MNSALSPVHVYFKQLRMHVDKLVILKYTLVYINRLLHLHFTDSGILPHVIINE